MMHVYYPPYKRKIVIKKKHAFENELVLKFQNLVGKGLNNFKHLVDVENFILSYIIPG